MEYSIYQAKAHFSELLRRVSARQEVVLTHRGRRIAKIVAIEDGEDDSLDQRIDGLSKRGLLQPASSPPKTLAVSRKGQSRGALKRFIEDRQ